MFTSILSTAASSLTISNALACTIASLILGLLISITYMNSGPYSKNFVVSLVMLPALVQIVIMMVNGNLGTGVAVMGAFSLVRFRSLPGSSKEISTIFFAMAVGLSTGMGYISFAVVITIILSLALLLLSKTSFGGGETSTKELKITIPENLNYTNVFDDLFEKYTKSAVLEKVKTTNLGSMFDLHYHIELKNEFEEKEFIDELRCRNGNLTISCNKSQTSKDEL
jgi:uncharacterized membrane protein YhiD involved in acid resistance